MTSPSVIDDVTCLGCGCACDDIAVVARAGRIAEARNACRLGMAWFGDGQTPSICRVDGIEASLSQALSAAGAVLHDAARPLVCLAPEISTEAYGEAAAIADLLRGRLDSLTSATAPAFVLAGQELGMPSATLGEIRNRADVVVFWGIDVRDRYPRFASRYAPDPGGIHVPEGRRSRTVIAADIGAAIATVDADHRLSIEPDAELATLVALEGLVRAPAPSALHPSRSAPWAGARALVPALRAARYAAFVYDAEPDDRAPRSPQRFAAIASLAQTLNDRTRCAAVALRAGGNRSGADATLVAQTGYPFAIDFSRGFPRYDPWHGSSLALIRGREVDAVLVAGDATALPDEIARGLGAMPTVTVGPRASGAALGARSVVIDTGVDGIHAAGTAYRADDVPLPLRAFVSGHGSAASVLRNLSTLLLGLRASSVMIGPATDSRSSP